MVKREGKRGGRRYDLDMLRVAAILAVVVIHHVAAAASQKPVGSGSWLAAELIDSFLRWCVPVFVMISGALLIRKDTYEKPMLFFKKRFNRIFIPLVSWPIFYIIFHALLTHDTPTIGAFVKAMLAGHPLYGTQLYFLFLIAGLYVLAPIISAYALSITRRQLWIVTISICAFTALWSFISHIPSVGGGSLNMITRGLPYVGYFMLGYLLKDVPLKLRQEKYYWIGFAGIGFTIAMLTYAVSKSSGKSNFVFYDYPTALVFLFSVAAFMLGRFLYKRIATTSRTVQNRFQAVISDLAVKSFGIFLIHIMVRDLLTHFLHLDQSSIKQAILLILPLTLLLSWASVTLLRYVPKAKYFLG